MRAALQILGLLMAAPAAIGLACIALTLLLNPSSCDTFGICWIGLWTIENFQPLMLVMMAGGGLQWLSVIHPRPPET